MRFVYFYYNKIVFVVQTLYLYYNKFYNLFAMLLQKYNCCEVSCMKKNVFKLVGIFLNNFYICFLNLYIASNIQVNMYY